MDLRGMTLEELESALVDMGEPKFRGVQIYHWLHEKLVRTPDEMTNVPKALADKIRPYMIDVVEETRFASQLDGTVKFLFRLQDDHIIESVWMPYKDGVTVCISSQVGCRMGCRFCASTLDGLIRNLTASEMLDQVYAMQYTMKQRISNVVVMGAGEPLDNYTNLIRFIKLLSDEKGLNLSQRSIVVSSCGLSEKIRNLADEDLKITFALSLHAPTDEVRRKIMPIANRYPLVDVLDACQYYFERTGRRVTYEYSLIAGVNDSVADAEKLAKLLRNQQPCHVNLIPMNPVKERDYQRSEGAQIEKFKQTLEKFSINVTIRKGMGSDIDAACGQLRRQYEKSLT